MIKRDFILIGLVGVLALVVILSVIFLGGPKQPKQLPLPIQMFSPIPGATSQPSISIPPELQDEYKAQENYAKERQTLLSERPWLRQLPLKSGNYFVSYDPDNDLLLVSLYYSISNDEPKTQQLEKAKEDALKAVRNAGIDTNKQKLQFIETSLK